MKKIALITSLTFAILLGVDSAYAQNRPSNHDVVEAIRTGDFLGILGCVEYISLQRLNGYQKSHYYIVEYKITKKDVLSQQECMDKIDALSKRMPNLAIELMNTAIEHMSKIVSLKKGAIQQLSGEVSLQNTEKGWMRAR